MMRSSRSTLRPGASVDSSALRITPEPITGELSCIYRCAEIGGRPLSCPRADPTPVPRTASSNGKGSVTCGCNTITTWLLATSVVVAPMRLARKRSQSGWIVLSFWATMYQLGFDFQAVPATFASNRSGAGTVWVAQTSFLSGSDKSPAKESMRSSNPVFLTASARVWRFAARQ